MVAEAASQGEHSNADGTGFCLRLLSASGTALTASEKFQRAYGGRGTGAGVRDGYGTWTAENVELRRRGADVHRRA